MNPDIFIVFRGWGDGYGHGSRDVVAWYFDRNDANDEADRLGSGPGYSHDIEKIPAGILRENVTVSTREQLENRTEKAARDLLGVSRETALERLRIGALRGTLAEAVLTPLFDLLGMK